MSRGPDAVTRYLTHSEPELERLSKTKRGMAYWAGSGPENMQCVDCAHFCNRGVWPPGKKSGAVRAGKLKPSTCHEFTRLSGGSVGPRFDPYTPSCKYFDPIEARLIP